MPFIWPTQFLLATLASILVAIVAPWLFRQQRPIVASILSVVASTVWGSYEMYLHSVARTGDPLIRIDWFLLLPLALWAWLQAIYFLNKGVPR